MRITVALFSNRIPVRTGPAKVKSMLGFDDKQWKTFRSILRRECSGFRYSDHVLMSDQDKIRVWRGLIASMAELKLPKVGQEVLEWGIWHTNKQKWEVDAQQKALDAWMSEFPTKSTDYHREKCYSALQEMARDEIRDYVTANNIRTWREIPTKKVSEITKRIQRATTGKNVPEPNEELLGHILRRKFRSVQQNIKRTQEKQAQMNDTDTPKSS